MVAPTILPQQTACSRPHDLFNRDICMPCCCLAATPGPDSDVCTSCGAVPLPLPPGADDAAIADGLQAAGSGSLAASGSHLSASAGVSHLGTAKSSWSNSRNACRLIQCLEGCRLLQRCCNTQRAATALHVFHTRAQLLLPTQPQTSPFNWLQQAFMSCSAADGATHTLDRTLLLNQALTAATAELHLVDADASACLLLRS